MSHKRVGRSIYRSPRWANVRLMAKRRDDWKCVQCGSRHRLEVDHIQPLRDRPDLAFDLANLQTLCGPCHAKKTRIEVGMGEANPKREAWLLSIDKMLSIDKNY
jgi:5-methylcytosine-specific restriction protein A